MFLGITKCIYVYVQYIGYVSPSKCGIWLVEPFNKKYIWFWSHKIQNVVCSMPNHIPNVWKILCYMLVFTVTDTNIRAMAYSRPKTWNFKISTIAKKRRHISPYAVANVVRCIHARAFYSNMHECDDWNCKIYHICRDGNSISQIWIHSTQVIYYFVERTKLTKHSHMLSNTAIQHTPYSFLRKDSLWISERE